MSMLRVAVIQGGPSSEAAVSRVSAAGVKGGLEAAGHAVTLIELDAGLAGALAAAKPDVVFPVVHGAIGEDGCLQGLLEVIGVPYVGSDVLGSAIAADKIAAKRAFRDAGLPIAAEHVVRRGDDLEKAALVVRARLGPAVVVKPHAQGSAIGISRVEAGAPDGDVVLALQKALSLGDAALCETYMRGHEVTCGVLDAPAFGPARALPPTMIVAKAAEWYDFTSRYGTGGSEHQCPAPLPQGTIEEVQRVALAAHRVLGCRDLSRADFVVAEGGQASAVVAEGDGRRSTVTLLEVNTIPGMTPTSLYPEAARVAGVAMAELCDGLVRAALARGVRKVNAAVPMPK
jgi:D-alanine-D-alanine ligase